MSALSSPLGSSSSPDPRLPRLPPGLGKHIGSFGEDPSFGNQIENGLSKLICRAAGFIGLKIIGVTRPLQYPEDPHALSENPNWNSSIRSLAPPHLPRGLGRSRPQSLPLLRRAANIDDKHGCTRFYRGGLGILDNFETPASSPSNTLWLDHHVLRPPALSPWYLSGRECSG